MLKRLLIHLYAGLLKLYPGRFREEFGGEMDAVFAETLSGLEAADNAPVIRRLKMVRMLLREVWSFPRAYLDARRYQASLGTEGAPQNLASFGDAPNRWVGQRSAWRNALLGALPFLLFGLAHLLDGFFEFGGYERLAFTLDGSRLNGTLDRPAFVLTVPMGVYLFCVLGLMSGVRKGFPRWSYAYLGMSLFLGSYYANGSFYGVRFGAWPWIPVPAAILIGLVLARSLQPLGEMLRGIWNDWTRLSFAFYAFALPVFTVLFFDDDWGLAQLYGLGFDTLLLAAGAVAYLRSRTSWGRAFPLAFALLVFMVKGFLGGWFDGLLGAAITYTLVFLSLLLMPAIIGFLRRDVQSWSLE